MKRHERNVPISASSITPVVVDEVGTDVTAPTTTKAVRFAAVPSSSSIQRTNVGIRSYSGSNVASDGNYINVGDDDDDRQNKRMKRKLDDVMATKKNKTKDHSMTMNEDELDDVDDWNPNDDENDNDVDPSVVLSERILLEAKRERRKKRIIGSNSSIGNSKDRNVLNDEDINDDNDDPSFTKVIRMHNHATKEDDDDDDDDTTHRTANTFDDDSKSSSKNYINKYSLVEDGISNIEPFHMDNERNDGSGYFDGDTYIFRRRPGGGDDGDNEPDAWLDSLNNDNDSNNNNNNDTSNMKESKKVRPKQPQSMQQRIRDKDDESMDQLSEEELYIRLLPHLQQQQLPNINNNNNSTKESHKDETIMGALIRYGNMFQKRHKNNHSNNNKRNSNNHQTIASVNDDPQHLKHQVQVAQESFNSITKISNALLLKGKIDIYDMKRSDIERMVLQSKGQQHQHLEKVSTTILPGTRVQWEYQGNEDGLIHGPYTTQEMLGWLQAGYFIGTMAVQVRTISTPTVKTEDEIVNSNDTSIKSTSIKDDLLSDLFNDDEDNDGTTKNEIQAIDMRHESPSSQQQQRGEWIQSDQVDFTMYL